MTTQADDFGLSLLAGMRRTDPLLERRKMSSHSYALSLVTVYGNRAPTE